MEKRGDEHLLLTPPQLQERGRQLIPLTFQSVPSRRQAHGDYWGVYREKQYEEQIVVAIKWPGSHHTQEQRT